MTKSAYEKWLEWKCKRDAAFAAAFKAKQEAEKTSANKGQPPGAELDGMKMPELKGLALRLGIKIPAKAKVDEVRVLLRGAMERSEGVTNTAPLQDAGETPETEVPPNADETH